MNSENHFEKKVEQITTYHPTMVKTILTMLPLYGRMLAVSLKNNSS